MKNITEKQMQELLPDYLFGRLGEDEAQVFRENLPNFPQIEKELFDAQKVFNKVNEIDIDRIFGKPSINLSKNLDNSFKKSFKRSTNPVFLRYAIPFAAVIAVFMMFNNWLEKEDIKQKSIQNTEISNSNKGISEYTKEYFTENDLREILAEEKDAKPNSNPKAIETTLEYTDDDDYPSSYGDNSISESLIIAELNELDEEGFQYILNDLKNK